MESTIVTLGFDVASWAPEYFDVFNIPLGAAAVDAGIPVVGASGSEAWAMASLFGVPVVCCKTLRGVSPPKDTNRVDSSTDEFSSRESWEGSGSSNSPKSNKVDVVV